LQTNTDRYEFENEITVIDLGLRLADAQRYELESEPVTPPKNRHKAKRSLMNRGATEEEIDFLLSGQRIELNAFASDEFVSFIEEKLREHKIGKVIPKIDMLRKAYRRAT
jgi:hypothetical protein